MKKNPDCIGAQCSPGSLFIVHGMPENAGYAIPASGNEVHPHSGKGGETHRKSYGRVCFVHVRVVQSAKKRV